MTTLLRRASLLVLVALLVVPVALGATASRKRPRAAGATRAKAAPAAAVPVPAVAVAVPYDSTLGDSIREARLFMAWHAPYGTPGATANLDLSCRDTTGEDTLYLSFETGRTLEGFYGIATRLRFHPMEGDTLGPFWQFGARGVNVGGIKVQLDADGSFPCAQPWNRLGYGNLNYQFDPAVGEVQLVYAIPLQQTTPVSATTRYCMARLIVEHRRCRLGGARQPVCVEWFEAFYSGGGRDLQITAGDRFVSINSPDGGVCTPYRRAGRVRAWTPKTPLTAPPDTTPWLR
jgi:hypothetical protein